MMPAMPGSFLSLRLAEFLRRAASPDPVPGGGAAGAIAASLGAAMGAMSCAVSAARAPSPALSRAARILRTASERLGRLADEDAAAYGRFVAALRMPRGPARERAKALSLRGAARAPLETLRRSVEALRTLLAAAPFVRGSVRSDAEVAAALLSGAARALEATFRSNLPYLRRADVPGAPGEPARLVREAARLAEGIVLRAARGGGK